MPIRNEKSNELIDREINSKLLKAMQIEFNREVKRKLTYKYLGVWTGYLRDSTGALIKGNTLYFGTGPWYGYGYETGDWSRVPKDPTGNQFKEYLKYKLRNPQRASWSGDKRKRPFMLDTINDPQVQANIVNRMRMK
jgi:hypothetical protein